MSASLAVTPCTYPRFSRCPELDSSHFGVPFADKETAPIVVAMMSRPVAGTRSNTLILTLPGSPKGAKENLESVIKLLPHACTQSTGSVNSRTLHAGGIKKLEADAGVVAPSPNVQSLMTP